MERPPELRALEARASAARLIYQVTGRLAVLASLQSAERQLEEYVWSHPLQG
jgi:hypothetical protein